MSDYSLLIFIQALFLLVWVLIVKTRNSQTPDFDEWLFRNMQYNPTVTLEDVFNTYIKQFNIMVLQEAGEPVQVSQARTKMQLIKQYNIDDVLGNHERYLGYKTSLERTIRN